MLATSLYLTITALLVFVIYNAISIFIFGMPSSLSNTFYLYQSKRIGLGYIFTAMMVTMVALLMPAWLTISDSMTGWQRNFTFLSFFAAGAIAFVGAAPAFRGSYLEHAVHMWSAKLCAVFAIAWCAVVCWRIMYIIPISIGVAWLIGWSLRNHTENNRGIKGCSDYIWELAAFISTFATIITQCIILINQ